MQQCEVKKGKWCKYAVFSRSVGKETARKSNFELLRIVCMLLIIAHHYVVNSGLTADYGPIHTDVLAKRSLFLLVFGGFGKMAINCFVLITGYFMCKSDISLLKYLKLYGETLFYRIIIGMIFIATGYEEFSLPRMFKLLLPFCRIETDFTDCFMAFYLIIPFINILVQNINERQYFSLLGILLTVYTGLATFNMFGFSVTMNYLTWFCVMYFIGAYIRLYPKRIFSNYRFWAGSALGNFLFSAGSIVFCAWFNEKFNSITQGHLSPFYFVADSNKILAVCTAISMFMFFKNWNISYKGWINSVGASTYGVLLIHANSDAMRQWLWKDVLDNLGAYSMRAFLPVHAVGSVLLVFIVCFIIDFLRIRYVEKPFLHWLKVKSTIFKKSSDSEGIL